MGDRRKLIVDRLQRIPETYQITAPNYTHDCEHNDVYSHCDFEQVPFKFKVFEKMYHAHQGCTYLIPNIL